MYGNNNIKVNHYLYNLSFGVCISAVNRKILFYKIIISYDQTVKTAIVVLFFVKCKYVKVDIPNLPTHNN